MKYYRCRCGKRICWASGEFPRPCEGCRECGTTLVMHPDDHQEIQEHELRQVYDRYTGEPTYQECTRCYRRIEE